MSIGGVRGGGPGWQMAAARGRAGAHPSPTRAERLGGSGAAAAIYSRAGVRRVEPKQVIVGREEAFFTADEEERAGAGVVLMPQ